MDRRISMSRFKEPDDKDLTIEGECFNCGIDLLSTEEVVSLEDFLFCDLSCLREASSFITLGGN